MDYLEVLHRSWNIIWKHKVLWIFGIMAGCARGGGGGGGSGWSESRPYTGPGAPGFDQFANGAGEWIGTHLWIILVVGLAVLLMIALGIFLGTVGASASSAARLWWMAGLRASALASCGAKACDTSGERSGWR
jgi:hypothetical protein